MRSVVLNSVLTCCLLSTAVHAQDINKSMLVLDASGSMWGQINGKTKIEIAREVIANTVSSWDENHHLGLIVYGHNRQGDCNDIEQLIAPSRVDSAQFSAVANKLSPKGKTPLSAAVKIAAEKLAYTQQKATVILVSDGKETCSLDPCAVGKSLEESGVDFTAHVIGFDVSKEDSIGLRCLAEQTGGAYLDAKDADQLGKALQQTREVVTDGAQSVRTLASVSVPIEVFAGSSFTADWTGPKNRSDYLIIRSDTNQTGVNAVFIGDKGISPPTTMVAPDTAGTYAVHYSLKDKTSLASDKLQVITPEANVDAPDSVVAGQEFAVEWFGPHNEFDSLRIFKANGEFTHEYRMLSNVEAGSAALMTAPVEVGDYEVRYKTLGDTVLAKDQFKITEAIATVSVASEANAGAPIDVTWTGPRNEYDRLRLLDSAGNRLNIYRFVHKEGVANTVTMIAPPQPGDYFVAYDASSEKIIAKAKIRVNPIIAMVNGPSVIKPEALYKVEWHGPNYKGDSIYTYSVEGKDMREYKFLGKKNSISPIELQAPKEAGDYELRYQIKGGTVITTHRFTVQ